MSHMPLSAADWAEARALFELLLDRPSSEHPHLLAESGASAQVQHEVRALLQHAAPTHSGFLAQPAQALQASADPPDRSGERLGAWRITGLLGRGGMGEVWAAERADGAFDGRVAVKLLKRGMDSQRVLARFAQEQRALARLKHPHIAHLIDAGRSADGLPYFVMEAVDGLPIDQACLSLPLDQRLALFLQLADAVAHAHRQLLLHRDLKPSNVLVTAEGQVKLLDFGIAKALDPVEGHDGQVTIAGERPFTPQFASPEQVRGEPVGTATDIYSLGVLLYVMLTGIRPYGRDATTPQAAAHSVLNDEPTRPSALSPGLATDPHWTSTRKRLQGDLDNILLKALDKRVAQRYASVDALATDIQNHLAGYPVSARAQGPAYLLAKFAQRNKALVVSATLGLLALVGGLGATAWQAHEAALARDSARARLVETRQIARDVVLRYADAIAYLPGGMTLRAKLLKDTVGHLDRLAVDAPHDAALAGDLAVAYARIADQLADNQGAHLDDPEQAHRYVTKALALFPLGQAAHAGEESFVLWWARSMRTQSNNQRSAGDAAGALLWRQRQRDMLLAAQQRGLNGPDLRSELGSALIGIGQAYDTTRVANLNRPAEALKAFAEAETVFQSLARDNPKAFTYPYQLGTVAGAREMVLIKQQRYAEARPLGEQAVAWRRQALALDPDNVALRDGIATEANNLALVLLALGQPGPALALSTEARQLMLALERQDASVPTWGRRRQGFALHHGRALLAVGRAAEAVPILQEAVAAMASFKAGTGLRRKALGELSLAEALMRLGQTAAAQAPAQAAADDLARFLAELPQDAEGLQLQAQSQTQLQTLKGGAGAAVLPRPAASATPMAAASALSAPSAASAASATLSAVATSAAAAAPTAPTPPGAPVSAPAR